MGLSSPTAIDQAQLLGLIGRRLRTNYDGLLDEPMPDRLAMLVRQLEQKMDRSDAARLDDHARDLMAID